MPGRLENSVVVIMGASSGIGRAAALQFAGKGARLVLASRRAALLDELARQCEHAGAPSALAVPTDVTDEQAMSALARYTVETFGRIDVWVNNAGAAVMGRFEETPLEDHLRVIETDLFGTLYGIRAVLPVFKRQGGGVLINIGSLDSKLSEPYMSSYVAAKHGIAGFGMALRQELMLAGEKGIHVCTVMPETIDTPFFQHAANYTGRAVKAMPPVLSAERVARAIVRMAEHPRREVFVGLAARQFWLQYVLAPGLTERMFAVLADKLQLSTTEAAPATSGSLYEPMAEGAGISGGWKTASGEQKDTSKRRPLAATGLGLMASLALGASAWITLRARTTK